MVEEDEGKEGETDEGGRRRLNGGTGGTGCKLSESAGASTTLEAQGPQQNLLRNSGYATLHTAPAVKR